MATNLTVSPPSYGLNHLHLFLERQCGFHGAVLYGGSSVLGEAGPWSDTDYYLLADDWFVLLRLLRTKEVIVKYRQEHHPRSQYILTTRWLLRHGWVCAYGIDQTGQVHASKIMPSPLRHQVLRVAYAEFVKSQTGGDEAKYHLGKSLLFALTSVALSRRLECVQVGPLFSVRRMVASLPQFGEMKFLNDKTPPFVIPTEAMPQERSVGFSTWLEMTGTIVIPSGAKRSRGIYVPLRSSRNDKKDFHNSKFEDPVLCKRILEYKLGKIAGVPTTEEREYVRRIITQAHHLREVRPFSLRSFTLYNIFAFRQDGWRGLSLSPDSMLLGQWEEMIDSPNEKTITWLRSKSSQVLVI